VHFDGLNQVSFDEPGAHIVLLTDGYEARQYLYFYFLLDPGRNQAEYLNLDSERMMGSIRPIKEYDNDE
jgi:hypothetical protein